MQIKSIWGNNLNYHFNFDSQIELFFPKKKKKKVDRSGSMSGSKMNKVKRKEANKRVIQIRIFNNPQIQKNN